MIAPAIAQRVRASSSLSRAASRPPSDCSDSCVASCWFRDPPVPPEELLDLALAEFEASGALQPDSAFVRRALEASDRGVCGGPLWWRINDTDEWQPWPPPMSERTNYGYIVRTP